MSVERKELSRDLQQDPLNLRKWTSLQQSYLRSDDHLSAKSVAVILAGLAELEERRQRDGHRLTNMQRHAFSRLALAHNNAGLLKEIGIFYLHEFQLPAIAIQHFEMAKKFRTSDGDLEALMANAKSVLDRQRIQSNTAESGVHEAKHVRPPLKEVLERTGKLAFCRKTEGLPTVPKNIPLRETVPVPKVKRTAPEPASPPAAGGGTQRLPGVVRTPRVAARQPEEGRALPSKTGPSPPGNALRIEHEGEYLSLEQATGKLSQLAYQERFASTLALLEAIIEASPRTDVSWSAATLMGQACFQLRQYGWARAAFQHAANLIPDEMVSWFNLGLALQNLGRLNDAMEVYQRADQLQPGHPKVWCNMSALHFQGDQSDQAEHAARKSLEADPTYARAWDNLATALGAQGRTEEAEHAALRAVSFKPAFPEPWLKLGIIYFQQDRLEESEEAFLRARGLAETSAYATCYLAIILARRERREDALAMVERATGIDAHCEILWMSWNELGLAHLRAEDYSAAETVLAAAVEARPDNFDVWFNRALAFQCGGQLENARLCYRNAVERDPQSLTGWRGLRRVAGELNDTPTFVEASARLAEWDPQSVSAWSGYARALELAGREEEAREARARAREITARRHAEATQLGQSFSFLRDNT